MNYVRGFFILASKYLEALFLRICRVLFCTMTILVMIAALLLFANHADHEYHRSRVSSSFLSNRQLYESIVNTYAGIENHSGHYSTPKELLNIGVVNIYNEDGNIVFLYSAHDNIPLGYGQGIIYIQHKELVPHWRILNNISDQWYYFIDPSL